MKILYIECDMGVAGDMLSAALLELFDNRDELLERLNKAGIPGTTFSLDKVKKHEITGSHLTVKIYGDEEEPGDHHGHHHDHEHDGHHHDEVHEEHHHDHEHDGHYHDEAHEKRHHDHEHGDHHHVHRSMKDIEDIVKGLAVDDTVKQDVMNVYRLIAEAESTVHGTEVSEIHFHEVGSLDAVADITATCLLMQELSVDNVVVSPVHVGSGQIKSAHGVLPVPAPATACLLKGIPSYGSDIKGELCTPTGAALVKYFGKSFGPQPMMSIDKTGYGMGKKDFERANCVRVFLGDSGLGDSVVELVCNLDDMTPEEIGFATERLMEEGALDVFTTAIGMKKNRPGTMLTVLCRENEKDIFVRLIFKFTTTIGIRERVCRRYVLDRTEKTISDPMGDIRVKEVSGYGVSRSKKEYEDLAAIARKNNTGLRG